MQSRILEILTEIRPEFDFSQSSDYFYDGLLDSFDVMLLVSALDKEYAISIEGSEIVPENFSRCEAIESLLKRHGVGE